MLRKQHVILPILSKKGKKSLFVTAMDHKSATLLQQKAGKVKKSPNEMGSCVAMTQGSIGYWLQNALINEFATSSTSFGDLISVTKFVSIQNPSKPSKSVGPFIVKGSQCCDGSQWREHIKKMLGVVTGKWFHPRNRKKSLKSHQNIGRCWCDHDLRRWWRTCRSQRQWVYWRKKPSTTRTLPLVSSKRRAGRSPIDRPRYRQYLHQYNQPNQQALGEISVHSQGYIEEGHFAAGSMLPIEAAIDFVEEDAARTAIITSIES